MVCFSIDISINGAKLPYLFLLSSKLFLIGKKKQKIAWQEIYVTLADMKNV
jgi:hypothetical protein